MVDLYAKRTPVVAFIMGHREKELDRVDDMWMSDNRVVGAAVACDARCTSCIAAIGDSWLSDAREHETDGVRSGTAWVSYPQPQPAKM